jgi:hypothetical protein
MSIQNPMLMLPAVVLAIVMIAIAWGRFIDMPKCSLLLLSVGALLLALAAGRPVLRIALSQPVTVLVDVSPSTRGADFRNFDLLRKRLDELLHGTTYKVLSFANGISAKDEGLREIWCDQTRLNLPPDAAVVLFSDGRFDLPASGPPTYPVIDPNLQDPPDGMVKDLELRGNVVVAHVGSDGRERLLNWNGTADRGASRLPRGNSILQSRAVKSQSVTANLSAIDLWPENDTLSLRIPAAQRDQRWWISSTPAPADWTAMSPSDIPVDPGAYLCVAAIVIDDVSIESLAIVQQQRLQQYVRDLGGAVVLGGGDHAFAVGGWTGTMLDGISPLASTPPQPSIHWILLADSSGSMAQRVDQTSDTTRWSAASEALMRLIPTLPPADLLSTGSFAADVHWWSWLRPASESAKRITPPTDIHPDGPTNLSAALQSVAKATDGSMPVEVLILSDADASIDSEESLAKTLAEKHVRPHLLALAPAGASNSVAALVSRLGGTIVDEKDPSQWSISAARLLRGVAPIRMNYSASTIQYDGISLPQRRIEQWNATWPKSGATMLAHDGQTVMAASWRFGAGQVIASAFQATPTELVSMADSIAQASRDPKFSVSWQDGAALRMTIDARDGGRFLNDLTPQVRLTQDGNDTAPTIVVPQTAPGRYEIDLPAPQRPAFAVATVGSEMIARRALVGRYPKEFDSLGNDREALEELARRTGGKIIEASDHGPIDFDWPRRSVVVASWTAIIGALFVACGLTIWRRN